MAPPTKQLKIKDPAKDFIVEKGFDVGSVGFSTGSSYYHGPWSSSEELLEFCILLNY